MKNVEVEKVMQYFKATERFVDETSLIIDKLCEWRLATTISSEQPSREEVLAELEKFKNLSLQAKKDGIVEDFFAQTQARTVIQVFKMFSDIVPELSKLQ